MTAPPIVRADSAAYWDAEGWDPDDRVYVGASSGETNHLVAVQPEAGAPKAEAADAELPKPSSASGAAAPEIPQISRKDSSDFWDNMQGPPAKVDDKLSSRPTSMGPSVTVTGSGSSVVTGVVPVHAGGEVPEILRMDSACSGSDGSFWDHQASGTPLDSTAYRRPGTNNSEEEEKVAEGGEDAKGRIKRVNSGQYWDADGWDPDERVYVGADAGQKNHLVAVDLKAQEQAMLIWRIWAGGLSSASRGLGEKAGPPIDLSALSEGCPKLPDLYDITETLGVGSFGAVRSGTHRATSTTCAVKALGKMASGERYRKNVMENLLFERLLRMTREAPHVNVAHYLDMMEGPSHWYVVMEELSGPELLQHLEDQFPVTEAYLQLIMAQVVASLAHIHSSAVGMVHRDIKLSNYRFRSPEPGAPLVLLDFGFACPIQQEWDGAHCGTLMFMAPEILGSAAKVPHLAAMDMWAAGVILYVLLTGDSPVQEAEVKLFNQPETADKAEEVLAKALNASELSTASSEATDMLKRFLVMDAATRLTAQEALEHGFLTMDDNNRQIPVSTTTIRKMRSFSGRSAKSLRSRKSADAPSLPDIDLGLDRIDSGDEEDHPPLAP